MSITDRHREYAASVTKSLQNQGFRVRSDLRNEKIGLKIREQTLQRVPYMLICGDREIENASVAVRTRNGKDLGAMALEGFAERLRADVARRGRHQQEE